MFPKIFDSIALFSFSTCRFRPPILIKQIQGSKVKELYLKEVLNSLAKPLNSLNEQLYYDANIRFRILMRIIHTVAWRTDDPEQKFNGKIAFATSSNDFHNKLKFARN